MRKAGVRGKAQSASISTHCKRKMSFFSAASYHVYVFLTAQMSIYQTLHRLPKLGITCYPMKDCPARACVKAEKGQEKK